VCKSAKRSADRLRVGRSDGMAQPPWNRLWASFLPLLLLLASGCASFAPTQLPAPPAARSGPALALAPFRVSYDPSSERGLGPEGDPEPFVPPYRPSVASEELREELAELLGARSAFEQVLRLDAAESSAELRGAARQRGARWLLEVWFEDVSVRLKEKNGLHGLKIATLIVSSILIFPAVDPLNWFLPGEDYELGYSIRWRLSEVSGDEVAGGFLELGAWDSFAAFGPGATRSWFVIGFLRAPGCLDEEDWAEIGDQLEASARRELRVGLTAAVEGALTQSDD